MPLKQRNAVCTSVFYHYLVCSVNIGLNCLTSKMILINVVDSITSPRVGVQSSAISVAMVQSHTSISKTTCAHFTKFSENVINGCGLYLL